MLRILGNLGKFGFILLLTAAIISISGADTPQTFEFTGSKQTMDVSNEQYLKIRTEGGQGESAKNLGATGGKGGMIEAKINATTIDKLGIFVGGGEGHNWGYWNGGSEYRKGGGSSAVTIEQGTVDSKWPIVEGFGGGGAADEISGTTEGGSGGGMCGYRGDSEDGTNAESGECPNDKYAWSAGGNGGNHNYGQSGEGGGYYHNRSFGLGSIWDWRKQDNFNSGNGSIKVSRLTRFPHTNAVYHWTVPNGVGKVKLKAWGAAGASGGSRNFGGTSSTSSGDKGAYAEGTLSVSPGETLHFHVGGTTYDEDGGWPNGGDGGYVKSRDINNGQTDEAWGGGGGGSTEVRYKGERILVAGGGAGGGKALVDPNGGKADVDSGAGGHGGEYGEDGEFAFAKVVDWEPRNASGGKGGASSTAYGGNGSSKHDGGNLNPVIAVSGGGGGGYRGGTAGEAKIHTTYRNEDGAAAAAGGGGGSSYVDPMLSDTDIVNNTNGGDGVLELIPAPIPPSNLDASETGSTEVTLDWTDNSWANGEFNIYRSSSSGVSTSGSPLATVSPDKTTYVDSSVTDGETYYYVVTEEQDEFGESNPSNEASVNLNDPPSISDLSPGNETFSESGSKDLSAVYNDPDNQGSITFYDSSDDKIGKCNGLSDGQQCTVTMSQSEKKHGENWWYAVAEDSKGLTAESGDMVFINNTNPYILNNPVSPADGATVYKDSFDGLKVRTADPDGDRVSVDFYVNTTGGVLKSVNLANDSVAESDFNTNRGETYKWWVEQTDGVGKVTGLWNTTQSQKWVFHRNDNPTITSVTPRDGSAVEDEDVELKVEAKDKEDNNLKAYFLNGDGDVMGVKDFQSGKNAIFTWENREVGEKYEWKVKVSDKNINTSTKFLSFRKLATISYRTRQTIEHDYSSVITATSSTQDIFLTVENEVSDEKNLRTYLSGVEATFLDGSDTKTYTLPPQSSRRLQVRLKPESTGDRELVVTTENRDIGFNTTSTIPVQVRKFETTSSPQDVPGIGPVHIFMLLLASTFLYSVQL